MHPHLPSPAIPCPPFTAATGEILGGYNPAGWQGQGQEVASDEAYLFFFPENGDLPVRLPKVRALALVESGWISAACGWATGRLRTCSMLCSMLSIPGWQPCSHASFTHPIMLQQVGGPGEAVFRDEPKQGLWFGRDGLVVPLSPGSERAVKSKLGAYYSRKPDGARHLISDGVPVKGGSRGCLLASLHVWTAAA